MAANLNLTILDSAILVFSFKLTHTCQDWFPPFFTKNHHSFILTQLDDGSHLEFCHLEFGYLGFSHLSIFFQTDSHLPRLVPTICTKNLHSFILTQLHDGSHLEICHLKFGHLVFCHLNIFFQTDSHLPRLVPTILTKHFTHSFWLNLMMAAILNSAILNLAMLDAAILEFPLKVTHTCQDCFSQFAQNISHIHSDSTWWWQPSWILPCWFQSLPSWIQTPCYLLSDSLQYTLPPLWLWLKLIQSDSNSFILN